MLLSSCEEPLKVIFDFIEKKYDEKPNDEIIRDAKQLAEKIQDFIDFDKIRLLHPITKPCPPLTFKNFKIANKKVESFNFDLNKNKTQVINNLLKENTDPYTQRPFLDLIEEASNRDVPYILALDSGKHAEQIFDGLSVIKDPSHNNKINPLTGKLFENLNFYYCLPNSDKFTYLLNRNKLEEYDGVEKAKIIAVSHPFTSIRATSAYRVYRYVIGKVNEWNEETLYWFNLALNLGYPNAMLDAACFYDPKEKELVLYANSEKFKLEKKICKVFECQQLALKAYESAGEFENQNIKFGEFFKKNIVAMLCKILPIINKNSTEKKVIDESKYLISEIKEQIEVSKNRCDNHKEKCAVISASLAQRQLSLKIVELKELFYTYKDDIETFQEKMVVFKSLDNEIIDNSKKYDEVKWLVDEYFSLIDKLNAKFNNDINNKV